MFGPVDGQLGCRRIFAARHFNGHFHRSSPDVRVILRSAGQRIPSSAVCRSIGERRRAGLAGKAEVHGRMVPGVQIGQMLKHIVIRRQ